jgi:hypothetical protein
MFIQKGRKLNEIKNRESKPISNLKIFLILSISFIVVLIPRLFFESDFNFKKEIVKAIDFVLNELHLSFIVIPTVFAIVLSIKKIRNLKKNNWRNNSTKEKVLIILLFTITIILSLLTFIKW